MAGISTERKELQKFENGAPPGTAPAPSPQCLSGAGVGLLGCAGSRFSALYDGQACGQPALPAAIHRFDVGIAHFLQIIGHES